MRTAERDEYQVGSLVGGLPTCTFAPKSYHRVITNIVVTNTATSSVECYRGILGGGVPVAQNLLGSNNTLRGDIKIPAGQAFYVQWSAVGASVQEATARVQWERDDNPFELEAGRDTGQEWASEAITSLQVPSGALLNDAAIVIGSDLPACMQATYASAVLFRPKFNQAPDSAPTYFIAQRKNPVGANFVQTVEHGFVIDNGVMCGYVVQRRVSGGSFNGLGTDFVMTERWASNMEIVGLTMTANQVQYDGVMDIFLLSTSTRFFVYGDRLSLRNSFAKGPSIIGSTTALNTFVNYPWVPGPALPSIVKVGEAGNTDLEITMDSTFYTNDAATGVEFAVNVNGSDSVVSRLPGAIAPFNHLQCSGVTRIFSIAPGTYTVTPRWRRATGAGTLQADHNDWCSISVREVAS